MSGSVSIIIPAYNALDVLKENLEQLKEYNKHFELIFIDDGSTDNTESFLKSLNFNVFRNSQNLGVASSRNVGAHFASGSILCFIDSDVKISITGINKLVDTLKSQNQFMALGAIPKLTDDFGKHWSASVVEARSYWPAHALETRGEIIPLSGLQSECCVIYKNIFLGLGGFNETYKKSGMEEFDFGHRMEAKGIKNGLLTTVTYQRKCKPLTNRLNDLIRRSSLYVELFLRRKKIESTGSVGNKNDFYSLFFTFLLLALVPFFLLTTSSFLIFLLFVSFLIHLCLESHYLLFFFKKNGLAFSLFNFLSIYFFNIAVLIGIFLGFLRLIKMPRDAHA